MLHCLILAPFGGICTCVVLCLIEGKVSFKKFPHEGINQCVEEDRKYSEPAFGNYCVLHLQTGAAAIKIIV